MSVHLIQSWPYLSLIFFFCQNLSLIFIHLLALISFPREKLTDLSLQNVLDVCVEVEVEGRTSVFLISWLASAKSSRSFSVISWKKIRIVHLHVWPVREPAATSGPLMHWRQQTHWRSVSLSYLLLVLYWSEHSLLTRKSLISMMQKNTLKSFSVA